MGRDGMSSRIQRRNPHALCLQSFVYVCRAHGRPRLRGEWNVMEGNKFIFFNSVLSALLEIGHGNVKENLREYYFMETRKSS